MTTASKITVLRVLMVPVFMIVLLSDLPYANYIALAIFIIASVTDFVDGYIARHYDQITDFGKFIDPLADKLLVFAALLIFVQSGLMPAWAAMVILTREFAVTGLRLVAVGKNRVIAAGLSGKVKTFSSMVCICIMLTDVGLIAIGPIDLNWICVAVMVVTTVWSGVEYFIKNNDVLDLG
ncbi:MAG: CDP-diacylglycerol--glycerol-3-phosphate 3-phosphatidyltransferase [Ruminococcaceae bacterium]|nr:CDP-diacylglycerol--glycerol-3-phosphate 3-phosphatidyltransferase [Oscillospiraceae bacterium]